MVAGLIEEADIPRGFSEQAVRPEVAIELRLELASRDALSLLR